eukprot:g4568.t1
MLKWEDFLAAVQRCGPWSGELKQLQYDAGGLCGEAKKVFWPELKALLLGGKAGDAAGGLGAFASVLHSLRKLRNSGKWETLLNAFRRHDPGFTAVVTRTQFLDALSGPDSETPTDLLSEAELEALMLFFSKTVNGRGNENNTVNSGASSTEAGGAIDWMLLLQDLVQSGGQTGDQIWRNFFNSGPGAANAVCPAEGDESSSGTTTTNGRKSGAVSKPAAVQQAEATRLELQGTELTRMTLQNAELGRQKDGLQEENGKLRDKVDLLSGLLQSANAERSLPQNLRQLASTVTYLEKELVQKTERMREECKKREISLETELRIQQHEVAELKKVLARKEKMLLCQRDELDQILNQMKALKPA